MNDAMENLCEHKQSFLLGINLEAGLRMFNLDRGYQTPHAVWLWSTTRCRCECEWVMVN